MTTEHTPVVNNLKGGPFHSLDELLTHHGPKFQHFRVNPARRTTIVGQNGTRLAFPPFAFTDLLGRIVQEEVEVRLKEAFSRPEMILAGKPSTSDGRLLESGGQFMVNAHRGSSPLQLCQAVEVGLPVQKGLRNPLAMKLYTGSTTTIKVYRQDKNFDWRLLKDHPIKIRKANGHKYYTFKIGAFNWYDCGYLIGKRSARSMVTVRMASPVEHFENQQAYLAFPEINAVAKMYPTSQGFTAINIPNKLSAVAMVIATSHGQLYFGKSTLEKVSDKVAYVKMKAVTEKETIRPIFQL